MAKESSSELSSLAARVLGFAEMSEPQDLPAAQYNRLLEHAKRLAGSVLSQDETLGQSGTHKWKPAPGEGPHGEYAEKCEVCGQIDADPNTVCVGLTEEAAERAHDEAVNEPEPSAPNPVLMRVEFINIITAHGGGKISFNKAALMVDKIIARQMQYYAAMADPQMEADNREQLAIVMEAKGLIEALCRQAGAVADYMPEKALWIRTAARARELAQKMEAMFS